MGYEWIDPWTQLWYYLLYCFFQCIGSSSDKECFSCSEIYDWYIKNCIDLGLFLDLLGRRSWRIPMALTCWFHHSCLWNTYLQRNPHYSILRFRLKHKGSNCKEKQWRIDRSKEINGRFLERDWLHGNVTSCRLWCKQKPKNSSKKIGLTLAWNKKWWIRNPRRKVIIIKQE